MKISRTWLNDYVDTSSLSNEELSELITTRVAEVEQGETIAASLSRGVVAHVLELKPHGEKLQLARLQLGSEEVQVVCGAANIAVNQRVAYLPPGSFLTGKQGQQTLIETKEVLGVSSQGVLVSESELGLSSEHEGIIVLPETAVGLGLDQVFGPADYVIEIDNKSLTHRPDLWSHFGFARELAAILAQPLQKNADNWADEVSDTLSGLSAGQSRFEISIDHGCGCRRFTGVEISGVAVEASPLWIRRRLHAVGAGVRNLLVDLSNYVMHDIGQPNHAYDADVLRSEHIHVRLANEGESFLGLDETERTLSAEDIVITDTEGPVALGGVIGGGPSAVSDKTSRLFLESANFDPVRIRKTTKRHGLRTDASNRFEKSQSVYAVPLALFRFAELLSEIQPRAQATGAVSDCLLEKQETIQVPLRYQYLRERLGVSLSDEEIGKVLSSLQFTLDDDFAKVPYFRATRDVSITEDLVEELGRILGYENVPESAPSIVSEVRPLPPLYPLQKEMEVHLAGAGFHEHYGYSFFGAELADAFGFDLAEAVKLSNPVDSTQEFMRVSLLPGLLQVALENLKHRSTFGLFEFGRAYHRSLPRESFYKDQAGVERRLLALCYVAPDKGVSSPELKQGVSFHALRGVLEHLIALLGVPSKIHLPEESETNVSAADYRRLRRWMHPGRAAYLTVEDVPVACIAQVHPKLSGDACVVLAELDLDLLPESRQRLFEATSKYPQSFFEMSVVLPKEDHYQRLERLLSESVPRDLLQNIEVLAVYEGQPLKENERSVSVKLSLGSKERTLGSDEIEGLQRKLMAAVEEGSYSLRS